MQIWITNFMEHFGYLGTFLLILIENIFPPIPSEVILTFGGFMTTNTNMTILGVVSSATAGSIVGAFMLYQVGRIINIAKLENIVKRWGHILRLKVEDIHKADTWFHRYGNRAVFFCRMIPLIRSLISIPAGMSNMKLNTFLLYTTAGTLIWNVILVSAGAALGESWEKILRFMEIYSNVIYVILGLAVIALFVLQFFKKKLK
ncbi:membrane protein DedA, SNARE-associated domain [Clostridium amylolyticum]|uniref:Membrane protein DedA, SNARE-associated domain n=1 Tax=Clostridium amylolyticum TaxID=1121298 RepID=A0A1M6C6H4_9CLOT|nr:DedA family protein [Clostridium amylolyticum]SHI56562.1 membrane protein DedA, SNARE-associated domain [Clostridium amylolyticum]